MVFCLGMWKIKGEPDVIDVRDSLHPRDNGLQHAHQSINCLVVHSI